MIGLSFVLAARKHVFHPQHSRRLRGFLRVGMYVAVVLCASSLFAAHRAKADVAKSGMALGRELSPLLDEMNGDSHRLDLNGQPLFMNVSFTDLPITQILDKYEEACRAGKADYWKDLPASKMPVSKELGSVLRTGVVRSETNGEGVVLCLVKGNGTPAGFADATRAFAKSRDLGSLGKLRYAYVKPSKSQGSRVLTLWTEDSFNFEQLAPSDDSEPAGRDPVGLPRLPGSSRLLSAEIAGSPFGMYVYRAKGSPEAAAAYFDKALYDQGWMVFSPDSQGGAVKGFLKDGVVLTVGAVAEGDNTLLSLGTAQVSPEEKRSPQLRALTQ